MSRNQNSLSSNGSATLLDLEALYCPVCCYALTNPIFQCNNGHIVCSTCCNKLMNKCPSCALPIGQIRCRAMERIIEALIVPCPNVGCTKSFSYGKESTHEKECAFSLCSCPYPDCNNTGSYKDLYSHFDIHRSEEEHNCRLILGFFIHFDFGLNKYGRVVMDDYTNGLLFVAQFFIEPHGVYVTMSCIAPPAALEVGEFSGHICTEKPYTMTFEFPKIKRTPKLNVQIPEDDFMLVPSYIFRECQGLRLKISVYKSSIED